MYLKKSKSLAITVIGICLPVLVVLIILDLLTKASLNERFDKGGVLTIAKEDSYYASKNPLIEYTWAPNLKGYYHQVLGYQITTNDHGFRTKPFTAKGDKLRIMLLGDSISFGVFLAEEQCMHKLFEEQLSSAGIPVEVFNLGIPNYSIHQEVACFNQFSELLEPDLVILQFGPVDFLKLNLFMYQEDLDWIPFYNWMRFRIYQKNLVTDKNWSLGVYKFEQLVSSCRTKDIPLVVLQFGRLSENYEDIYYKRDHKELSGFDVPLVEASRLLKDKNTHLPFFRVRVDDNIHPNAEAHQIIADAITPQLEHITIIRLR